MIFTTLRIHDLPAISPDKKVSFHATKAYLERIWWDGEILEVVTTAGEVWRMDFDDDRWVHTEDIHVENIGGFTREDVAACRERARTIEAQANNRETTLTAVCVPWRDLADRIEALLPPE